MRRATESRRDSQRQKLYDAEHTTLPSFPGKRWGEGSVPEMQAYVDKLLDSAWFKRHWPAKAGSKADYLDMRTARIYGDRRLKVKSGAGCRRALYGRGEIQMPLWARREYILLHEIAHYVTVTRPSHGWQFAQNYLLLIQHQMGKAAADALRKSFKAHRVKYTKPRAKRPLSEEEKAVLRERLAKARLAKAATRGD